MRHLAKPAERIETRVVEKDIDEETRAELVRKMLQARKQIVESGEPLLDWDELEREIAERRGERNP